MAATLFSLDADDAAIALARAPETFLPERRVADEEGVVTVALCCCCCCWLPGVAAAAAVATFVFLFALRLLDLQSINNVTFKL